MDLDSIKIGSIDELLNAMALERTVSVSERDAGSRATRVPTVVRKLRAARLKRRMDRSVRLGRTKRAGKSHWKARKAAKRRERQAAWYKRERKKLRERQLADPPRRYKEILRRKWKPRLAGKVNPATGRLLLEEVMTSDQYCWLMDYQPDVLFELHPDVIVDTKARNLDSFLEDDRYILRAIDNSSYVRVIDTYHKIVRLDTTKSYTLDNILVVDYYSNCIYYKPN